MRNPHVWNLLALHVPNLLPKTVPWFDFNWHHGFTYTHSHLPRKAGRLIWATVMFTIGLVIAFADHPPAEEVGRARDVGADVPRRDVRVGHADARLRRDPVRVDHLRQLVPELRQRRRSCSTATSGRRTCRRSTSRATSSSTRSRPASTSSCSSSTSCCSSRGRSARSPSPQPRRDGDASRRPPIDAAARSARAPARPPRPNASPRTAVP